MFENTAGRVSDSACGHQQEALALRSWCVCSSCTSDGQCLSLSPFPSSPAPGALVPTPLFPSPTFSPLPQEHTPLTLRLLCLESSPPPAGGSAFWLSCTLTLPLPGWNLHHTGQPPSDWNEEQRLTDAGQKHESGRDRGFHGQQESKPRHCWPLSVPGVRGHTRPCAKPGDAKPSPLGGP